MPLDDTEQWTRPSGLRHHPHMRALADGTRLDVHRAFGDGDGIAEPTRPVPLVPERTTPPPYVKPAPSIARPRRADGADGGAPAAGEHRLDAADFLSQVMDEQRQLNLAHSRRLDAIVRPRGPLRPFRWRPLAPPSLREVAAARQQVALEEERRRYAHNRRMDRLAEARSVVALICLVMVFALIVGMGYVGWQILDGAYTWAPVRVR